MLELLLANPWLLVTVTFILGLLIGSFLNVVILRLPPWLEYQWQQMATELLQQDLPNKNVPPGLILPRSRCPKCGHGISAWENIPVISYVILGGKCRQCKTKISIQYPLIELITGLLSVVSIWHFGFSWEAGLALIFTWLLIALAVIDIRTQLLPDNLTYPLLWLGLLVNLNGTFTSIHDAILGAVFGYLSLWSVYQLFKLLTKKEGMGYGDFKLLAALGAWMGWQMLPQIILISSVIGIVISGTLMLIKRHDKDIPFAFGQYIAIAGWVAMFWGQEINQAYLKFSGIG